MSVFNDPPKPTYANPAARPFSRSDYDVAKPIGGAAVLHRVAEPHPAVTIDKLGDFLELDFRRLFVWLRAGLRMATILAVVGGIAGGAYAMLSKPRYTVGTDILINPANLQVVANDLYSQPGQVDSQVLNTGSKVRVLTSRNVLTQVVDELQLYNDAEFFDPTPSLLQELIGTDEPIPDGRLAAQESLEKRVRAVADEKSFVATLLVSAETTTKAIAISQSMVKSFQEELARGEAEGANRAAAALDDRLDQLKSDVQIAEEKVEAYKRLHRLSSTDGKLVSSQSMAQLNAQLGEAQSRVIAAQASYDALGRRRTECQQPGPGGRSSAGGFAQQSRPLAATARCAINDIWQSPSDDHQTYRRGRCC